MAIANDEPGRPEIGVGVIGTGFMGMAHAQAMLAVDATFEPRLRPRLVAVADVDAATAAAAARRWGFARATTDWRDLVADPAVEIVSITSPNLLHREMALTALAAGKHVWCEKPLAMSAAEAGQMADAAAAARRRSEAGAGAAIVTLVGYNYLRSPALELARRLIANGRLGRIAFARFVFDEDYMASAEVPWSWRCSRAHAGMGALGDLGSHAIGLARWLLGPITEVVADMRTTIPSRMKEAGGDTPVDNDDVTLALLRFASGASAHLGTARVAWGRKNGPDVEIHGSEGSLRFSQERFNEIELFEPGDDRVTNGFRRILTGPAHPPYGRFCPAPGHGLGFNDLKTAEAAHLLESIASGSPAFPDFAEGAAIERVADAIARSAETRRWESVAPGDAA